MNFELNDEQQALRDTLARLLDAESSMSRVRAALEKGGDTVLWKKLADLGLFSLRVSEEKGGLGLGAFEAVLLMEEVGRTLATGPIAETILAARLISRLGSKNDLLTGIIDGNTVVSFALYDIAERSRQWVTGGAVADLVIAQRGDDVVAYYMGDQCRTQEPTLIGDGLSEVDFTFAESEVIGCGKNALTLLAECIEEWKLLLSATLSGLARESLRLAAEYACERKQFDVPIGTFQAISHPLADLLVDVDGGKLLTWKTLYAMAQKEPSAAALCSLGTWWNIDVAGRTVAQALHTFGGYGLTTEYDIHLYNLKAKSLPLVLGDPRKLLKEGARRRYDGEQASIPDVGEVYIHFDRGAEARALAAEVDAFFSKHLTSELKEKAHYSWDGHDPTIHKKLAEADLLFPAWPKEAGGRGASPYALNAISQVWEKHGWGSHAANTTGLVAHMMHRYGSEELKEEVLSRILAGEVICSLGYSEPGSGSDVFAAQCRATREGDEWVIEGTKMFTSGANISDYVLMLTRTNPGLAKHQGLTMFIVPLKAKGVSVQPVYTFQDERTNITFYDRVRISDSFRLGEVDKGVKVMAAGLELEHGGGFAKHQYALLEAAESLCKNKMENGMAVIADIDTKTRLARTWLHSELSEVIANRALWASENRKPNVGFGPMAKLFSSEKFLSDSRDLLELTAPESLSKREGAAGFINQCYRHAQGTTIYGGTSEIHRSQIAERALGLPRSRG